MWPSASENLFWNKSDAREPSVFSFKDITYILEKIFRCC